MACALRSFSLFLCIAQRERERDRFRLYHTYAFDDISIANSNGKERQRRQNETHYKTVPDVLRVLSRRAPRGHDVTNLVRVALEPIALVFLKRLLFGEEKSSRWEQHTCARLRDVYKHFQFEREKHIIMSTSKRTTTKPNTQNPQQNTTAYLFAHVQLELLSRGLVELQTAHGELVRLERHDKCTHRREKMTTSSQRIKMNLKFSLTNI